MDDRKDMRTIREYKDKIIENQAELRMQVFELMAAENISLARLALEIDTSWATVKRFLNAEKVANRETTEKLKEWLKLYE